MEDLCYRQEMEGDYSSEVRIHVYVCVCIYIYVYACMYVWKTYVIVKKWRVVIAQRFVYMYMCVCIYMYVCMNGRPMLSSRNGG
jgi:hypothetical protein